MSDESAQMPESVRNDAQNPLNNAQNSANSAQNPLNNAQSPANSAQNPLNNAQRPAKNAPSLFNNAQEPQNQTVRIHTDYITLQNFLKLVGAVDTGGEAKIRIQNCEAQVNGQICTQRGKKLRPGDFVLFRKRLYTVGHGR